MAQSRITTPRLVLAPFSERHLTEAYLGWLRDRQLMRYSEQRHHPHTMETCWAYFESFRETPNYFWAIEAKDLGDLHIGNINAYVDEPNSGAEMGLLIGATEAQGKGYGLEAWRGAMNFLIKELGIRKVSAGAMSANRAMLAIMERSGMVPDGVRRRHFVCEGREVDVTYACVFRTP